MKSQTPMNLLIYGDSHSVIWGGNKILSRSSQSKFTNVNVRFLGPALAYNLFDKKNHKFGKWGKQIFTEVEINIKNSNFFPSLIMLSFGEIDIRTQIIKRAIFNKKNIEYSVLEVVKNLNAFAEILFELIKIPILLWEPIATNSKKNFDYDPTFPTVGSEVERNYATEKFSSFSKKLSQRSRRNGKLVYSFGIANKTMSYYETKTEYFEDNCHLNNHGFVLALDQLKKTCVQNNLPRVCSLFAKQKFIYASSNLRNISLGAKIQLSSIFPGPYGLSKTDKGWCFHTCREHNPSCLIDIGYAGIVKKLIIYNRFDGLKERCVPLLIYAGSNNNNLTKVLEQKEIWGYRNQPLEVNITNKFGPIRFILLKLEKEEFFHLGEIKIYEQSFEV